MTLPKNKAVLFLLYNIKFLDVNLDKESERQPYLKEKRVFVLKNYFTQMRIKLFLILEKSESRVEKKTKNKKKCVTTHLCLPKNIRP